MPSYSKLAAVVALAQLGRAVAQNEVLVDVTSTHQQMDGFGVSQAFGRASQFEALDAAPRKAALDYLFSTETGAGLTMIRNRIGSGGVNDSIEPNSPGGPNAKPTYVWDDNDSGQVWFSNAAMSYGVHTIYADAWSAPGFMKTNGNESDGGYLCGTTGHQCASGDWRQAYANFLVQYVRFYKEAGISITQVGFLNEPDLVTAYSSMESGATEAASFIPILYHTLHSEGFGDVQVACCDDVGWPDTKTTAAGLIADGMEKYLGVLTSHMYSGDPNSTIPTNLKTWMTEGADLNDPWCNTTWYSDGGLCEGLTWAGKIATGVLDANLSAYFYWEGTEVNEFQASSYLVASNGTAAFPSGRLWAFAMWSRFVRPGAHRVSTSGSMSGVQTGAFKNADGSVVVIFTNTGSSRQFSRLNFKGFNPTQARSYLTDNTHTLAKKTPCISDGGITVSVPAYSVLTVKLSGR